MKILDVTEIVEVYKEGGLICAIVHKYNKIYSLRMWNYVQVIILIMLSLVTFVAVE